jgi:nitrite reductase/ring-hydroxylating ferredoxin subunit
VILEPLVSSSDLPISRICTRGSECGEPASRRDFLREAASLAACAAAFGVTPSRSLEFAVRLTGALRLDGGEAVYPIPPQDSALIDRDHDVILVRDQNHIFAFVLWCPHQRTALRWEDQERRFRCPKHKSTFQPDGTFISGRSTRAMDRYALRREGETIVVDLSTVAQADKDPEGWGHALVQL